MGLWEAGVQLLVAVADLALMGAALVVWEGRRNREE